MNIFRMLYTTGTWVCGAIGIAVFIAGDYMLATSFFLFSMIFTQASDISLLREKVMYAEHNLRALYIAMRLGDSIQMVANDEELEAALKHIKDMEEKDDA